MRIWQDEPEKDKPLCPILVRLVCILSFVAGCLGLFFAVAYAFREAPFRQFIGVIPLWVSVPLALLGPAGVVTTVRYALKKPCWMLEKRDGQSNIDDRVDF